ncbi:MAG: hypothetical protein JST54_31105 [Deltaproteobacteria bacterium]|nr:hypothetical protein [Deltaproteobacteria bacterium]
MITWRLERWRPPRVKPLEVWNLPYRDGLLYERLCAAFADQGGPRVDAELAQTLAVLCQLVAPRDPIWISGGLAARPGLQRAFRAYGIERARFASEPLFPAEAGGRAELAARGLANGLVVDLGQTSLKLSRTVIPRPKSLPVFLVEHAPPPQNVRLEQAARLADFVSEAIASHVSTDSSPALVLGLPCALDDRGTPGTCTYAGWSSDVTWAPRMLSRLDALLPPAHPWHGREVLALLTNDAELAAASAALELPHDARALVVTLGFGPGAAWLETELRRG